MFLVIVDSYLLFLCTVLRHRLRPLFYLTNFFYKTKYILEPYRADLKRSTGVL